MPSINEIKVDLNENLISCRNYVRTLTVVPSERDRILLWFQDLCEYFKKIIGLIGDYYKADKETFIASIQNTILLYLTQLLTSLSLLINVFVKEEEINHDIIKEARSCVIKQILFCLESIEISINSGKIVEDSSSGNFVKWMDASLEKIAEINMQNPHQAVEIFTETQQCFEEVLSHAMSIAQIALEPDNIIIRASCKSVLAALNSLNSHINTNNSNTAMINLFIDASSDKLCILERKVNTAVLKLCMETFANFPKPLRLIKNFCSNPKNRTRIKELDELIADFDLHVDRIVQIGLFAVSCSSDLKRGIKIRSCLASLEALESELIPSMTSNLSCNNCADILMKHWLDQVTTLQELIYLIIDPYAFAQVIYEEACAIVQNFSTKMHKDKLLLQDTDIESLLRICKVFQDFLNKAQIEFSETEREKLKNKTKDFLLVLDEVDHAACVLLTVERRNWTNSLRVLKSEEQEQVLTERDLPVQPTGNVFLDHIINRGKEILQDRSVMYRTPLKHTLITPLKRNFINSNKRQANLSKFGHLRGKSFTNPNVEEEDSIDLQITGEITVLKTTLRKN